MRSTITSRAPSSTSPMAFTAPASSSRIPTRIARAVAAPLSRSEPIYRLIVFDLDGTLVDSFGDLAAAVKRVKAIYKNYLSTNALHWYFGKERLELCGKHVLGPGAQIELMPFSEHIALPPWCRHMGTTKLLVSSDGHGFALDVGGEQQLQMLRKALADGLIRKIEGIWVTHLHNDHTARVPAAAREFGCPVYAVAEVADGLKQPGAWFLPGGGAACGTACEPG